MRPTPAVVWGEGEGICQAQAPAPPPQPHPTLCYRGAPCALYSLCDDTRAESGRIWTNLEPNLDERRPGRTWTNCGQNWTKLDGTKNRPSAASSRTPLRLAAAAGRYEWGGTSHTRAPHPTPCSREALRAPGTKIVGAKNRHNISRMPLGGAAGSKWRHSFTRAPPRGPPPPT